MALSFEYSVGETIKIYLDVVDGDTSDVSTIQAHFRKATGNSRVVDPQAPLIASFVIAERDEAAGWALILDAATSADLTPGLYLVDARLTLTSGEIVKTSALAINIVPAVTRP